MEKYVSNVNILKDWLRTDLQCVPGKREFSSDRYFIASICDAASAAAVYHDFVEALRLRETVAGLFVVSEAIALPKNSSAEEQFQPCAELMCDISEVPPDILANGGRLGKCIELECPVTGVLRVFNDFDAVAFCPQSMNLADPLYDPMMATPVPCINFNSDIYAFSMFTRDMSLRLKKAEIWELSKSDRRKLFDQAAKRWQQFAEATIAGYMSITDLDRCPMGLADGNTTWLANHQDPAFAEKSKSPFVHHMPVLYTPKIIAGWEAYFATGRLELQPVEAITPFGFMCSANESDGLH